jgi:hypothetical protein
MTLNQLSKPISRLKNKELSPSQAWSRSQVDAFVSDHCSTNEFRVSIDGVSVSLTSRSSGEEPRQQITIPRQEFNKMIQWYTKPQRLRSVREIARNVERIASETGTD